MKNFMFVVFFSWLALSLSACATTQDQVVAYKPAIQEKSNDAVVQTRYVPVPMPGQLLPKALGSVSQRPVLSGVAAVNAANQNARRSARSSQYINAIMNFDYMDGALYQIYCAPLSITDIQFQPGEHIVSVAAGDTLRWQVSKTYSGTGTLQSEHLIVKPIEEGLTNTLVVMTDYRTYHLLLRSTSSTYMASVQWRYPDSDSSVKTFGAVPAGGNTNLPTSLSKNVDISQLDFKYRIQLTQGNEPDWMPVMVFNDGKKTYIQFPKNMQEAPTLFVGLGDGSARVVNYRVEGEYYIVDGVVAEAQLRLGQDQPTIVNITSN